MPFGLAFVVGMLRLRGTDAKVEQLSPTFFGWGKDKRKGQKYHRLAPIADNTMFVRVYGLLRVLLLVNTTVFTPIRFKYALSNAILLTASSIILLTMLYWRKYDHPSPKFAPFQLNSSNAIYAGANQYQG